MDRTGEIVLYQPDEKTRLEVRIDDETVWLSQQQMAHLFDVKENTVTYHIKEIYNSMELDVASTARKIRVVRLEGSRKVTRQIDFYNLDIILSIGYRVNSVRGIMFRRWSSTVLKQHLLQGYSINRQVVALQQHVDDRLLKIEGRLDRQQEEIDFYIRTNQKPTEFVIPTGCVWDAYSYFSDLVRNAKKRIILIDNFVDDRTLLLLDKRTAGVDATVYTRYSDKAELDFEKHNAQYAPVKMIQLPKAIHDRYLIVDDDVWLLGASVKDMGHGLTTVIHTGISPDYILDCVR